MATPSSNSAVGSVRGGFGDSNKAVLNVGELFAFKAMLIKEKMKDEMTEETMPSSQLWEAAVRIFLIDGCRGWFVPAKDDIIIIILVVVDDDNVVSDAHNVVSDARIFDEDRK